MVLSKKDQIIDFDSLDREIYLGKFSVSEGLKDLIHRGEILIPKFQNFVFDLFLSFYKAEMLFNQNYEPQKSTEILKTFIDEIYSNQFIKYIRNDTFLDETKSTVATVDFGNSVLRWFESNDFFSNKSLKDLNELNAKEQVITEIEQEIETINEIKDEDINDETAEKLDSLQREKEIDVNKLKEEIEQSSESIKNNIKDNNHKITKFINSSLMDMDTKMSDYYSNSTVIEDNINSSTHPDTGVKIDLANKLIENDKLRKLANMMGSLKDVMQSVKNKNWKSRSQEIHSITLGNDIGRAISSEIIKLANESLKKEFYTKYLDGRLQQYHLKEQSTKGPFIICLDCSSSMSGDKEIWSKAVALTLVETARKQRRKCDILAFTSSDYEVRHFDLQKSGSKSINSEEFIKVAEYFPGGGTSFEKPLSKALDLLKEYKENNADIVFVTDGESHIGPAWLESFDEDKKKYEFKVYSVLIDLLGTESQNTLELFSDKITNINKLTADNSKKIFVDI